MAEISVYYIVVQHKAKLTKELVINSRNKKPVLENENRIAAARLIIEKLRK